jgi:hypothetical protein
MTTSYTVTMRGRERDNAHDRRERLQRRVADVLFASLADSDIGLDPSGRARWLRAVAGAIMEVVEETT